MKILDAKGRLFGKINIVDFAIIIFILIVIPYFLWVYKILGKYPERIPHEWVRVEAVTFIIPEWADFLKEGDTSSDQFGNVNARILKILKRDEAYSNRLKHAKLCNKGAELYITVFFEFELLCTKSSPQDPWYFERKPLFLGLHVRGIHFDTDKYNIGCKVLKILGNREEGE